MLYNFDIWLLGGFYPCFLERKYPVPVVIVHMERLLVKNRFFAQKKVRYLYIINVASLIMILVREHPSKQNLWISANIIRRTSPYKNTGKWLALSGVSIIQSSQGSHLQSKSQCPILLLFAPLIQHFHRLLHSLSS